MTLCLDSSAHQGPLMLCCLATISNANRSSQEVGKSLCTFFHLCTQQQGSTCHHLHPCNAYCHHRGYRAAAAVCTDSTVQMLVPTQWLIRAPERKWRSGTYKAVIMSVGHADVVTMAHSPLLSQPQGGFCSKHSRYDTIVLPARSPGRVCSPGELTS